ncbi:cartilage matrix protein, partial [Chrysochromulina tobinii]
MAPFQAQVLEFARELVLQLDFGPSASRVGLVEFDDTAHVLSYLSSDPNAVLAAMATAQQANGWTNISSGLASGLAVLQAKGGWTTRSKVLLLLTDGEQNPQYGGAAAAIAQAATVRAAGVQIFGVGFGSANPATIADISSSPASLYAFTAANIGACDDGGPGSEFAYCTYGTDCIDCGTRQPRPPPPPRAPQCTNGQTLDLVLVFDHSGSMAPFQAQVLEFARELILQLDFGPSAARVGLVEFDSTATVLSSLSSDPNVVLAAMATAQQAS